MKKTIEFPVSAGQRPNPLKSELFKQCVNLQASRPAPCKNVSEKELTDYMKSLFK